MSDEPCFSALYLGDDRLDHPADVGEHHHPQLMRLRVDGCFTKFSRLTHDRYSIQTDGPIHVPPRGGPTEVADQNACRGPHAAFLPQEPTVLSDNFLLLVR